MKKLFGKILCFIHVHKIIITQIRPLGQPKGLYFDHHKDYHHEDYLITKECLYCHYRCTSPYNRKSSTVQRAFKECYFETDYILTRKILIEKWYEHKMLKSLGR